MNGNKVDHKIREKENKPFAFTPEMLGKVRQLMLRYPEGRQKSALLPVLHIAQEESGGYLTVEAMDYIADLLQVQPVEVYEVATFYAQFRLEKAGKYVIEVCRTNPCAFCGGERILEHLQEKLGIEVGETTPDGLFTLLTVECLGACGQAPVMQVNMEYYENLDTGKIDRILEELRNVGNEPGNKSSRWAESFF